MIQRRNSTTSDGHEFVERQIIKPKDIPLVRPQYLVEDSKLKRRSFWPTITNSMNGMLDNIASVFGWDQELISKGNKIMMQLPTKSKYRDTKIKSPFYGSAYDNYRLPLKYSYNPMPQQSQLKANYKSLDESFIRKLEQKEERRVEAELFNTDAVLKEELIDGVPYKYDDWTPIDASTNHTKTLKGKFIDYQPGSSTVTLSYQPIKMASMQKPVIRSFSPRSNSKRLESDHHTTSTTTEEPLNYPKHFLLKIRQEQTQTLKKPSHSKLSLTTQPTVDLKITTVPRRSRKLPRPVPTYDVTEKTAIESSSVVSEPTTTSTVRPRSIRVPVRTRKYREKSNNSTDFGSSNLDGTKMRRGSIKFGAKANQ